jgi:hypothetical protein
MGGYGESIHPILVCQGSVLWQRAGEVRLSRLGFRHQARVAWGPIRVMRTGSTGKVMCLRPICLHGTGVYS